MFDPKTLRGRLTFAYSGVLLLALLLFAFFTLIAFDAVQRRVLDAELSAVASAEALTVDIASDGTLDLSDQKGFTAIAGRHVSVAIVKPDERIVISSTSGQSEVITQAAAAAERRYTATLTDRGEDFRATFVPLASSGRHVGTIAVWSDVETIGVLDRNLGLVFAVAIPVFGILATFGGDAIARRGLIPLERIISDASLIDAHDVSARLALPSTKELSRLAMTLNGMLERIKAAFDRERQFTADASHELRAPLAIILAEADLALAAERSGPEYQLALETIAIEADGLEALTRNLLATVRAGDSDAAPAELVDLGEVAASVAARMQNIACDRGLTLRVSSDPDAVIVGDANQIEQAILTIVHNAVKYARSECVICVDSVSQSAYVLVRVNDDGPGFSADAREHGFDRFWGENAGPAFAKGHGLGLAIARATVERCHGTITLMNRCEGGAMVTVLFPKAL